MRLKNIKVGRWYETTNGIGECIKSGGTFPASVRIRIALPMPLGMRDLAPRDVKCEVPAPPQAQAELRDATENKP